VTCGVVERYVVVERRVNGSRTETVRNSQYAENGKGWSNSEAEKGERGGKHTDSGDESRTESAGDCARHKA